MLLRRRILLSLKQQVTMTATTFNFTYVTVYNFGRYLVDRVRFCRNVLDGSRGSIWRYDFVGCVLAAIPTGAPAWILRGEPTYSALTWLYRGIHASNCSWFVNYGDGRWVFASVKLLYSGWLYFAFGRRTFAFCHLGVNKHIGFYSVFLPHARFFVILND
jgi:hypothetical protein